MVVALLLLFALLAAIPAAAEQAGAIEGVVTTKARGLPPLRVSFDQKVCGTQLPDAAIVADGAGHLANVVVTVTGVKAPRPWREGRVLNERCSFVPRVQVLAPGAAIKTSSRDAVLHTTVVQQLDGRQLFNVALPAPGIELAKSVGGAGVLRVGCSTHQWMRAWIVVTDELAVITGPDGRFRLPDLPPGTYELRFWHEALKLAPVSVTVKPGATATVTVEAR